MYVKRLFIHYFSYFSPSYFNLFKIHIWYLLDGPSVVLCLQYKDGCVPCLCLSRHMGLQGVLPRVTDDNKDFCLNNLLSTN